MRWPKLVAAATLTMALVGCDAVRDKIPFLAKKAADTTVVDTAVVAVDTPTVAAVPDTQIPAEPEPLRRTPPVQVPAARAVTQLVDEPWEPEFLGTIDPGMTREQVVATWGPPVAERMYGNREYLYFRNGCEVSCGTFDVVFLEGGQVIDAIVRGLGHEYAGVSSSPPDRAPAFTPPILPSGDMDRS